MDSGRPGARHGTDAVALEHEGDIRWALEDRIGARQAWQRALDAGGDPDVLTPKLSRRELDEVHLGMPRDAGTGHHRVPFRRPSAASQLAAQAGGRTLQELDARAPEWTTMGIRMESTASAMGRSGSFSPNVRVARDSVIWMSISPALGVEAARVLLTPDSVQVLSKLPGARFVFQGDYDVLEDALQSPVSFGMVQDLILGRRAAHGPHQRHV